MSPYIINVVPFALDFQPEDFDCAGSSPLSPHLCLQEGPCPQCRSPMRHSPSACTWVSLPTHKMLPYPLQAALMFTCAFHFPAPEKLPSCRWKLPDRSPHMAHQVSRWLRVTVNEVKADLAFLGSPVWGFCSSVGLPCSRTVPSADTPSI